MRFPAHTAAARTEPVHIPWLPAAVRQHSNRSRNRGPFVPRRWCADSSHFQRHLRDDKRRKDLHRHFVRCKTIRRSNRSVQSRCICRHSWRQHLSLHIFPIDSRSFLLEKYDLKKSIAFYAAFRQTVTLIAAGLSVRFYAAGIILPIDIVCPFVNTACLLPGRNSARPLACVFSKTC